MAKVKINMPEKFDFCTQFQVRAADVNGGGHLGNNSLVALLNEAMIQFFKAKDFPPATVDGNMFINVDLAIIYQSEAFHGDVLKFEVSARDFHKYGFDVIYKITDTNTDKVTAIAKTGMLYFDAKSRKKKELPKDFQPTEK